MPARPETQGVAPDAEPIGGASNQESLTPVQGSIEDYRALLEDLKSLDDDALRAKAAENGIDAPQKMTRDELLAKLMDEPSANEI